VYLLERPASILTLILHISATTYALCISLRPMVGPVKSHALWESQLYINWCVPASQCGPTRIWSLIVPSYFPFQMDSFHQTTENSSSTDRVPTHVASAPHQTQSGPSRTTAPEGEQHCHRRSMRHSDWTATVTASSSFQLLSEDPPPALSQQSPHSEFFKGASHVDARGTFNAVGGDQHITIEMKVCL
jgi:hypothetical protein